MSKSAEELPEQFSHLMDPTKPETKNEQSSSKAIEGVSLSGSSE